MRKPAPSADHLRKGSHNPAIEQRVDKEIREIFAVFSGLWPKIAV